MTDMRIRKRHWGSRALFVTALAAVLLTGCIVDIDMKLLNPPSDGSEADGVIIDIVDTEPDLPDIDTSPEQSDCGHECAVGWTVACSTDKNWCISPYRGTGDCCQAWYDCQSISGDTFPGIWANAGPHNGIVPADFYSVMELPGVVIAFSSVNTEDPSLLRANFVCLDSTGFKREPGELHDFPVSLDCSEATCGSYLGDYCPGDVIGCDCVLPYWCTAVVP